jgi:hypothetical protein
MQDVSIRIIQAVVTTLVIGLVLFWLRKRSNFYGTDGSAQNEGVLKPRKGMAWFGIIVGFVFVVTGISSAYLYPDELLFLGPVLSLMGMGFLVFLLPSLSSAHHIVWTAQSLEGPCKRFGPGLGRARATIYWTEITKTGLTQNSLRYVETATGARIYWEVGSQNFENFEASLKQHRPDLDWPKLV